MDNFTQCYNIFLNKKKTKCRIVRNIQYSVIKFKQYFSLTYTVKKLPQTVQPLERFYRKRLHHTNLTAFGP